MRAVVAAAALAAIATAGCTPVGDDTTRPAAPTVAESSRDSCPNARTTLELRACAHRHVAATNRVARARAQAVSALLTVAARRDFTTAERAWRRYRDAACAVEASQYEGGSIEPVVCDLCVATQNRRHARELAALAAELRREG